ncbi:MAG: 4-demethylwyosine synthase TYW1 [archaeon]
MNENDYVNLLKKQHYAVFGERRHSAAKPCTWLKKSLKNQGVCYKQAFYGIQSHRCLQMTPNIYCNQRCVFCWRVYEPKGDPVPKEWDEPRELADASFAAQYKLLNGFGGNPDVDEKKLREAINPNQVALSLTGEPGGYPFLDELVGEYRRRGCSTFVVSNGLFPEMIERVRPTQLYVSLDAPNEDVHKKVNVPLVKNSWEKLGETISLIRDHKSRTALRITVVKGYNDVFPEQYAKIIEEASPDFLEVKGYMFIGGSRQRLTIAQMPYHSYVREFATKINEHLGYELVGEQSISRVILYSSGKEDAMIKVK